MILKEQLNKGQLNAMIFITEFLAKPYSPTESYSVTLSGFAGTGKSTLMNFILQELPKNKKVCVSAPTHKAKEVIADFTKRNAETIQALLGLRPNEDIEDFNPNKPQFACIADERICNYNIVVIDEASMLNKALVKLIEEKARENKVHVIYMGDIYQLPPVGEIQSIVFKYKNIVHLDEIVRQSNENPNVKLIELARNDVRDGTNTFTKFLQSIKVDMNKEEGFKLLPQADFYTELLSKYFDSEYSQNPNLTKTLAWTNDTAIKVNSYLRYQILKSKEMITVGDMLMGYKSITKETKTSVADYSGFKAGMRLTTDYNSVVKNSVDYIVKDVDIISKIIAGEEYKFYRTEVQGQSELMWILHPESYDLFVREHDERMTKARNYRQWKPYYQFKENFVLKHDLLSTLLNYKGEPEKIPKDIDYGYCITVHKSQGSTYQNVGIILKDLMRNYTAKERRQLIYVAVSRTSKTNMLY